MPKPKKELSDNERMFIQEYLVDFNATEAAKRAGYSERSAYNLGNRLKTKHATRILKALNMRLEKIDLSRDNLAMELRVQMMRCIGQVPVIVTEKRKLESGEEVWEDIPKRIFDANGFNKAAENLAKMYRLMDNKLEINVNKREMGVLVVPELKKDEEKDVTPKAQALDMKKEEPAFPPMFKNPIQVPVVKDEDEPKKDDAGKSV